MARLIYALLALAFATLVAGFLVRSTALPLLASLGLSAVVAILILYGWSKKLRESGAFGDEELEVREELALEELTDDPTDTAVTAVVRSTKRRRSRKVAEETTEVVVEPPEPKARETRPPRTKTKPKTPKVAVIPGRSRYHVPTCRFAKGDDVRLVSEQKALDAGYERCSVCSP